jgi:hypothetical protein
MRAIAILREVDECLLTEGPRRFTRPEVFVAAAILPYDGHAADMFGALARAWCRKVAQFQERSIPKQRRLRALELQVPISEGVARPAFLAK